MSDEETWRRVKVLFAQSLERSADEREAWLAQQTANEPEVREHVARLLAECRVRDRVFAGDAQALLGSLLQDDDGAGLLDRNRLDTNIGPYRLLRVLGEGGMGRVYLAQRADGQFVQQVALKLVRSEFATAELHQRFLRERNTLARLAHPNIAQLHDGGVSDEGAPYFTLEYVEGKAITRWCDERRSDLRVRVQLMLKICDAVQHAHRSLIVHRDLKPSNILVTDAGEPKLLDFGIAKPLVEDVAADALTNTGARPMTREYAAPEQVLGEPVTTATDIYALGVLLYLLLSGRMPYRRAALGQASWIKAILEDAPEPLDQAVMRSGADERAGIDAAATEDANSIATARSATTHSLTRSLRGDLDSIVQRALAKSPEGRYPTVSALADDLRAWLDGRALSGGTRTYRLRKFMRRHWLPLAAAALAIVTILGAALGIAWEARQREHEAERALREEHTTKAVKDFLFGLFTAVDPHEAKGRDITARELLDRGAKRIGTNIPDEPALKAELQSVLGRIYHQLGLYAQAGELQQQAIDALAAAGDQPLLLARTEVDRADTLRDTGDLKAASQLANQALARMHLLPEASANDRMRALYALGATAVLKRDFAEAKRQADAMLAIAHDAHVDDDMYVYALLQAGNAAWGLHSMDAAEKYNRELLALAERTQGPEGLMVASAHMNLALIFSDRSQYAQAIAEVQKALDIDLKVRGPLHSKVADERGLLGLYYFHQGLYGQSREMLEQVVAAQRANLGADHPDVAGTLMNLGNTLCEIPELGAAERDFAEARRIWVAKYGAEFMGAQVATASLGYVHRLQGQLDAADADLLAFKQFLDAHGQGNDPELHYQLAEVRRLRGDVSGAVALDRTAVQLAQAGPGESSDVAALAHHYLGLSLRDSGDSGGAERELRAALASFAGYIPKAEHPLAATTRLELSQLLAQRIGARAEAQRFAAEAVAIREQFLGANDPRAHAAREQLAKLQASR